MATNDETIVSIINSMRTNIAHAYTKIYEKQGNVPSSTEQEALTTQSIIRYTYNGSTFNIVLPNDFTYNSPFYTREVTLHTAASSISITANGTTTQLTDSYQAVSTKNVTVTTDNKTDTFNITIRAKTTTAGSGKYFAMLQIGVRPLTMTSSGTVYKIIPIQDMGTITYVVPGHKNIENLANSINTIPTSELNIYYNETTAPSNLNQLWVSTSSAPNEVIIDTEYRSTLREGSLLVIYTPTVTGNYYIVNSASLKFQITPNAVYIGNSNNQPVLTNAYINRNNIWVPVGYTITNVLTNVSADPNNVNIINRGVSGLTLIYYANNGYTLPNSITVTGASYTWDQSTGNLVLSNATSDVSVTIVGEAV